jgi:hypothetical protein
MKILWLMEVILGKADVSCQPLFTRYCCVRYTYSIGWLVTIAFLSACCLAVVQTKTQILCGYQSVLQNCGPKYLFLLTAVLFPGHLACGH